MTRRRLTSKCTCGGEGWVRGGNRLKDGTRKRAFKCQQCGRAWSSHVYELSPSNTTARFNGLTMHWRGYWYSVGEQVRIRESARMGGLL